ncbi:hypothetical protein [Streptomyces sp. NPDC102487]|uniref:hypothetical protein n=1 Tax=Streptomyces sp. NPDC102487 TaxID=3366182 RepID=UPI003811EFDE
MTARDAADAFTASRPSSTTSSLRPCSASRSVSTVKRVRHGCGLRSRKRKWQRGSLRIAAAGGSKPIA